MKVIDLHKTTTIIEATDLLEHELFLLYHKKEKQCQIIHGIGEGKLAAAVHDVLNKNPLVKNWLEDEVGGSCTIILS
jgi:dsDNA-specific endonuclease/ATPase MutS2